MITLLYIYFIIAVVVNCVMYFVSYSDMWDEGVTKIKNLSNSELTAEIRKKMRNKVIVTTVIIILMLLFL